MLIVRVGAMGDVLHGLPAVAALRAERPAWTMDWVVDPRWAPLLVEGTGASPVVGAVHLADTRLWSRAPLRGATRRSVLELRRQIHDGHYDAVVDLQGTLRSAVIGSFAGATRFAGFADPREKAAGWFYRQRFPRQGTHVVEQAAALLGAAVGVVLQPASVQLPRHTAADAWVEDVVAKAAPGGRFALLAPTAGWGAKQWPAERYGALARALQARGFSTLVNAATADEPVARAVVDASEGAAVAVAGDLSQLIALCRRAALAIGGDSGPIHLAAALGRPTVALFGPTDPARNGPWGPGPTRVLRHASSVLSYKRVPVVEAGLARITVEEVLEAAVGLLEPSV